MSSRPSAPETGDRPGLTRRNAWLAAVVGVAVLLVGVLVWALASRDDSNQSTATGTSPSPGASPSATASPTSPGAAPGAPGSTAAPSIPPPAGGSAGDKVNPKPQRVGFQETGRAARGVKLTITKVEEVTGKAQVPGEVGGPALRITVQVANSNDAPLPIGSALTNLYYGRAKTPAGPMTRPGAKPFPRTVPAGGKASGVVLYTVPKDERSRLLLEVDLDNELRTVEFSGGCPETC